MKGFFFSVISVICISLAACSGVEKVQKSKDFNYKLTKANEYFDKKKYTDAALLYEELLTVFKGTKNFEDIYYKYTYCFYNTKDYLQASYHFKNFVDIFPGSAKAEECLFMHCKCLYFDSHTPDLDQSTTIKAMNAIQSFMNSYPESIHTEECNNLIESGRKKLEQKDEINAYLYFKIGEFKSAGIAYKELIKKYPDSQKSDYYQLMVLKSFYNFARSSVVTKQIERYSQVLSDYQDFKNNYPKSSYLGEVETIRKNAQLELSKAEQTLKKQQ